MRQKRKRGDRKIDEKVFDGYFPSAYIGKLIPAEVKALVGTLRITVEQLMMELLTIARRRAQTPISGFQVGAVSRGSSGALYLGANLEFIGHPLQYTIHAEQASLTYAILNGETGIKALTVSSAPCGHCRQFINELPQAEDIILTIQGQEPVSFRDILPVPFGPADLSIQEQLTPRIVKPLKFEEKTDDILAKEAAIAASLSYSPYSGYQAGVAFLTRGGLIYSGGYFENAAYNPSVLPAQAAIINLIMSGRQYNQIERVAIARKESAKINLLPASIELIRSLTSAPIQNYLLID